MIELYFIALSFAIFAIGIAGIAASRHFIIMMLSAEVAIIAGTLLATVFFYYSNPSDIVIMLIALWSVAAAEVIALVTFYRYLAKEELSMDVTKLSKLRD